MTKNISIYQFENRYPMIGDHLLTSLFISSKNNIYPWGTIGNTQCCGSAIVVGMDLDPNEIVEFLVYNRVSVLLVSDRYSFYRAKDEEIFPELEKNVNKLLNERGSIIIKRMPDQSILILLTIDESYW